MPDRVHVPAAVADALRAHAQRDHPLECCGLLLGHDQELVDLVAASNELASATRYRIRASDHFTAVRLARARRLEVLGAYHSHPSSRAVPSMTDLADAHPDFLYVIIGADGGVGLELRGWWLVAGNFREIALVPVP
jgi:[CysO sulfur-carrier protein]-S-L-cysteine hydrolase